MSQYFYGVILEEPNKDGSTNRNILYFGDEEWLAREVYEEWIENRILEESETIYFLQCDNSSKIENITKGGIL